MAHSTLSVPTTELARHFGDYLARVRYGGDTIIVLKNNSPVAELRPLPAAQCSLRSFVELWRESPSDPSFADDLETVNRADRPMENPWD